MAQHFTQYDTRTEGVLKSIEWIQVRSCVYGAGLGGRFIGDLQLVYLDGHDWKLLKEFRYLTGDGKMIVLPAGFVTDFASIPRLFWSILPPTSDYGPAAAVHDFLYRTGMVSRAEADLIFMEAMRVLGVNAWKRYILYSGVRCFGAHAYKGRA